MRTSARVLAALLVVGAVLAGCRGGDEEPAGRTATGEATTEAVEAAGEIVFRFSGGIEGRDDRLVVQPAGTATVTRGADGLEYTRELSSEEVAELQRLLDESGLFGEDQEFEGDVVDDRFPSPAEET